MAIFHATTKPISRTSGRSATASVAYRSATKITDERTGKTFDYSKKSGVAMSATYAVVDGRIKNLNREKLWNGAELADTRKNSRTAREWIVAIPNELVPDTKQGQRNIKENRGAFVAVKFSKLLAERYGVAVDVAVHAPDQHGDNRNWHAHIMTTTREISIDDNDQINFGKKSQIEMSNKQRHDIGLDKTSAEIKVLREAWATIVNDELEAQNIDERIDHRSHNERGLDTQPTIKMGWQASALERKGIATDRGDINRAIKSDNATYKALSAEIKSDRLLLIPSPYYDPMRQQQIISDTKKRLDEEAERLLEAERLRAVTERDIDRMQQLQVDTIDHAEFDELALLELDAQTADNYQLAQRAREDTEQYYRTDNSMLDKRTTTLQPVIQTEINNTINITESTPTKTKRYR